MPVYLPQEPSQIRETPKYGGGNGKCGGNGLKVL